MHLWFLICFKDQGNVDIHLALHFLVFPEHFQGKNCPSGSFAKGVMPFPPLFNRPAHLDDLDWLQRQWYKDAVFKSSSWVPSTSSILLIALWIYCTHLLLLWTDLLFSRSAVSGIRTKLKRRRLMPLPKMRMKVRKRERAAGSDSAPGVSCALTNPKHPPCHDSPPSQGSQADPFCLSFTRPSANFEMIFPFAGWQYQWWPRSWWFPWATHPLLRLASVNCLLREEGKPNTHWALQIRFSSRTYIRHYTVSIVSGCRCF